jgi:Barstar (barnase inhibitor)
MRRWASVGTPVTDFGVTRIDRAEVEAVVAAERQRGAVVLTLTTGVGADKAALFRAARAMLPQDPPLGTYRDVWDALADSLCGGIQVLEVPRVVLAWPDADEMRRAQPADAQDAEEILTSVAETLSQPRFTANRPTAFRVYLT